MAKDHGDPGDAPSVPPPLSDIADATRPSAAEEARTIAASTNTGTLASLTSTGDPWASFVTYGLLDGAPVLCVSHMAEHGRNLAGDPRASLAVVAPTTESDPLASARITLAGVAERPTGANSAPRARPTWPPSRRPSTTSTTADFSVWVLRVHRVRWVGGYGRMDSATGPDYAAAQPDPIHPLAAGAISHLNVDHAASSRRWPVRWAATRTPPPRCAPAVDRYGLDLKVDTPRGYAYTRVGFGGALVSADELRCCDTARTGRGEARTPG